MQNYEAMRTIQLKRKLQMQTEHIMHFILYQRVSLYSQEKK